MKQSDFPPGWDEERVRRVLAHYEEQTKAEASAEGEAAFEDRKAIREIAEDEKRQRRSGRPVSGMQGGVRTRLEDCLHWSL